MAQKTAPRLTLQLVRFEYRHIYSIDQLAQTFSARVFILLKIPAGEFQERKAQLLPEGDSGEDKPPFKSARWYLSQLRLHNMVDGGSVETNIVKDAQGGLDCSMLVEGTFHDVFQLREFPVDQQNLGVHLRCLCANEKSVPVSLVATKDSIKTVDTENFALSNVWRLRPSVGVKDKEIRMHELDLTYPGLRFVLCVHRRPGYYIVNVVVPTGLIVLLCACQYQIAAEDVADRMSVSLTLLLTTIAFKLVTSSMLPAVAYLTLLDRYVSLCSLLNFLAVLAAAVAGNFVATFDRVALGCWLGLWAVLHCWFAARILLARNDAALGCQVKKVFRGRRVGSVES